MPQIQHILNNSLFLRYLTPTPPELILPLLFLLPVMLIICLILPEIWESVFLIISLSYPPFQNTTSFEFCVLNIYVIITSLISPFPPFQSIFLPGLFQQFSNHTFFYTYYLPHIFCMTATVISFCLSTNQKHFLNTSYMKGTGGTKDQKVRWESLQSNAIILF